MILEVFISYAHQDQLFRNELDKHLSNLKRRGIISSWSDGDIAPGTEWRRQVMSHLDTAQIILLLISADFMASDFCYSIEMTRALERHRANEARVLPIILRPTDWKDAPFAALEVMPAEGKAVTRWPTHDDAFEDVIQGIRRAIQEMTERNERAERADRIGQRFGDYWLRRRLGGGGFGDVYLGEHMHTHNLAAVKVLHIRLTRSEELRAFINEVRTFRLQHPHIVRVLDVGITPGETPFLVMEYALNGTLRDRHPKGSRLPLSTVLTYVASIASALQYAHDLRLVHRDIKPENMLLGAQGELWLSDFGIATAAHSTGSLTTEGMGGTLPYMAPEQILGKPRAQSDQYALAIVIYEWLTGTWPFRGTPIEIAMQHQMAPPPSLHIQVPTLPPEVEQVVFTALSKDPKGRFGNVQAFATALVQAAQASLEQSSSPIMSQKAPSPMKHPWSEVAVEAAGAEQQQASALSPISPHITGAFPSPSTANVVSESSPDSLLTTPESVTSSAVPSLSLPDAERTRMAEEERRRNTEEREQARQAEEERARQALKIQSQNRQDQNNKENVDKPPISSDSGNRQAASSPITKRRISKLPVGMAQPLAGNLTGQSLLSAQTFANQKSPARRTARKSPAGKSQIPVGMAQPLVGNRAGLSLLTPMSTTNQHSSGGADSFVPIIIIICMIVVIVIVIVTATSAH